MMRRQRGVTLIELLIAITLVSLLATGMLFAMRVGLSAMESTNRRIVTNRRMMGAQRILEQELGGFMPARAQCGQPSAAPQQAFPFFQGQPGIMRFVSAYSMKTAWRGVPVIVELIAAPAGDGRGLRLLMNEIPYHGPVGAGYFCLPPAPDPSGGPPVVLFREPVTGPQTFVLADRLAVCRFFFEESAPGRPPAWLPAWQRTDIWPSAIRIEMIAAEPDATNVQPMPITVRLLVDKPPGETFVY